jgi:hypothetical protein
MGELDPATEQALADMSAEDWAALSARVRPPTSSEQLKTIAAKHIPEDQLGTFMAIANVKAFADEHGNIDEAKVQTHASRLFGAGDGGARNFGQSTGYPSGEPPGETARTALKRRHGVGSSDTNEPSGGSQIPSGRSARAELARRHGVK